MSATTEPIHFYSTTGEYGCFSNFYRSRVTIDGKTWRTSEHYFQAQRHYFSSNYFSA